MVFPALVAATAMSTEELSLGGIVWVRINLITGYAIAAAEGPSRATRRWFSVAREHEIRETSLSPILVAQRRYRHR